MSVLSDYHKELDESGEGRCSVPMFCGGGPAGFCDNPAYGFRPPAKTHYSYIDGFEWRDDLKYAGYVPGLACAIHGGPDTRAFKDGNMFCAVHQDFINLQESSCGFGETAELARMDLAKLGRGK